MTRIGLETLTVVVINYGMPELSIRCANALTADGVPAGRIAIVDNGSADDSVERLKTELPKCVVVALPENVGYSRAANAGASALHGDHYIVTNNDAFVHKRGSVAALLKALEDDPARGIVVPRVVNDDLTLQPTVKPLDTPAVALVRASGLSRFIPNRWQPRWSTHWDHATSADILAADGPIVLVRGETWAALGGFNPRIRMFAEDTDLCWRARKLGWKTWFSTEAEFMHLGKATSVHHWPAPERAQLVGSSEGALLVEQLGPVLGRMAISFTVAGLGVRWLAFSLRRDRKAAAAIGASIRGYVGTLRNPTPTASRTP